VRLLATLGLLLLGIPTASSADTPFGHPYQDEADTIVPLTSYPLGESQVVAHALARNVQMYWIEQDMCDRFGCLVVHNDTRLFKVAEFRILAHLPDGRHRWSANLLEHPLLPTESTTRIKTASVDCERPIQFVLKQRKTKEVVVMEGTTNLCTTPHADNVIRINVKQPEVTIDESQTQ
jgi:hypothetical protein